MEGGKSETTSGEELSRHLKFGCLRVFNCGTRSVNCVRFFGDADHALAGTSDRTIYLLSAQHGILHEFSGEACNQQEFSGVSRSVKPILATQDKLIVASLDGCVYTYDLRKGALHADCYGSPITCDFLTSSRRLPNATGAADMFSTDLVAQTQEPPRVLDELIEVVERSNQSPSGIRGEMAAQLPYAVSGSEDCCVYFWDVHGAAASGAALSTGGPHGAACEGVSQQGVHGRAHEAPTLVVKGGLDRPGWEGRGTPSFAVWTSCINAQTEAIHSETGKLGLGEKEGSKRRRRSCSVVVSASSKGSLEDGHEGSSRHVVQVAEMQKITGYLEFQLLKSRSRPLGRVDKCRFIALAGAWATAAFCDSTAATDYWFLLDTPLQFVCMPLACASFLLSATAALVSSSFSRAAADAMRLAEPPAQPEEKVPLAAPEGPDSLESLSPATEDDSNTCMLAGHGACLHAGFLHDAVANQLHGYCPCPRCETQDSISTGLPVVAPSKSCHTDDSKGRQLSSGGGGLGNPEGETRFRLPYSPQGEKEGLDTGISSGERQVSKDSVFTPSHAKEGSFLAGLTSREGRRAAFRGLPGGNLVDDGWPRTRTSEFCRWDFPSVTGDAAIRHSSGLCVERQTSASLCRDESLTTTASISSSSASRSGKHDSDESWSRCSGVGSSPLLSEFLEEESADVDESQLEQEGCGAASKYLAGRVSTAHGIQYASFPDTQETVLQGLEAGWKPYLSLLGFQAAGVCKRGGVGRTRRIGDLKWLDVMIVDMEGDVGSGFGSSAASRMCDV
ncbi:hypothetical protein ACSSS7_000877 [Eimeria intestinalis]